MGKATVGWLVHGDVSLAELAVLCSVTAEMLKEEDMGTGDVVVWSIVGYFFVKNRAGNSFYDSFAVRSAVLKRFVTEGRWGGAEGRGECWW